MTIDTKIVKPDFVIIGAMKSATTFLQEQLEKQSGIFMSDPKEPNFFSNDEIYSLGLDWYWGLFSKSEEVDIAGEASTHYTKLPKYPRTAERLKKHLPDTKLIYVMRHPIDRLVSHYIHNWTMGFVERRSSIDEAIASYDNFVNYSLYSQQLKPWLEVFGKERVLPIFFDRLMAEPQSELERICSYIGYSKTPVWQPNKPSNASRDRVRKLPMHALIVDSSASRWIRNNFIPKRFRSLLRRQLKFKGRPTLNIQTQARLEQLFDDDLKELGVMLDIELNCGNFKDVTRKPFLDWCDR